MNPPTSPRRLRALVSLVAAGLVGVVLGVVADRAFLWATQRTPDPRLYGEWVGEEGEFSFHQDGTYDSAHIVTTTANGNVTKTKQKRHTAQYRWVNRETIEMYEPLMFQKWLTWRVVFEGDQLTLLGDSGVALRYTRKKD